MAVSKRTSMPHAVGQVLVLVLVCADRPELRDEWPSPVCVCLCLWVGRPDLRDEWLANLNYLLVNQATQDTAKVMNRDDVRTELRTMSFRVAELRTTATRAKVVLEKQQLSRITSMRLSTLQSMGSSAELPRSK